MRTLFPAALAILLLCNSFSPKTPAGEKQYVLVQWVNDLAGDFSFKEKWDYPEGVYRNEYGQLSCDGFCPEESYRMKDSTGKIFNDSLKAFYKIVDTTHQFHTLECEAWCYEWAGTDLVSVHQLKKGKVEAITDCNAATHCSLHLAFSGDTCTPVIMLNSIVPGGDATYRITGGSIKIDKQLWKKGIMKAEFSFDFYNPEPSDQKMFWKGKVWSPIIPSRK
ncbi:MAG TPA: hypothetical protein VI112_14700 [Bacteroidia bacterium]|jgi:hypothetical protein